jgi:hypothetical protein
VARRFGDGDEILSAHTVWLLLFAMQLQESLVGVEKRD